MEVNKTEGAHGTSGKQGQTEKQLTEDLGKQAKDEAGSYYREEKWQVLQHLSQSKISIIRNSPEANGHKRSRQGGNWIKYGKQNGERDQEEEKGEPHVERCDYGCCGGWPYGPHYLAR